MRGLARIFNAFIEGMNSRKRLPKYIVLLMDKDFIINNNYYNYGASQVIESSLHWLAKQIHIKLRQRKLDLFDKKPGTLLIEDTKVIWVKMIKRPYGCMQEFDRIFALRNCFNNALENVLSVVTPQNYLLSIKVEESDFHINGELSEVGQANFWKEIDNCLKLFDLDKINLKPKSSKESGRNSMTFQRQARGSADRDRQRDRHDNRRCSKLPTPPPESHSRSYHH